MNGLRLCLAVCVCSISFASSAALSQTGTISFSCAPQARSRAMVARALRQRVLEAIDTSRFENSSAQVYLIRIRVDGPSQQEYTAEQLTEGLTLKPQNAPEGLEFAIDGDTSLLDQCAYHYIARVITRGFDNQLQQFRTATTDSEIVVREQIFGRAIFR